MHRKVPGCTRLRVVVALPLLGLALTACQSAPPEVSGAEASVAPPPAEASVGVRIDTPATGVTPQVSADHAIAVFQATENHSGWNESDRTVELVSFSNDQYGTIQADGTAALEFQDRLSWMISYPQVEAAPAGAMLPEGVEAPSESYSCDYRFLVDALSGEYLMAYETCNIAD